MGKRSWCRKSFLVLYSKDPILWLLTCTLAHHQYITNNREVKIVTCTASATCDVMVREGGIPSCRCERVHLTFSTPSAQSTRSIGTAGENM